MSAYQFYHYPKCSTCRKAKKFLDENHVPYEEHDIVTNPPTEDQLRDYFRRSGLPLKRFFNTSGQAYREMGLAQKLASMDEADQFHLLASNGMLIKRPLLVGDTLVLLGFREETWREALT